MTVISHKRLASIYIMCYLMLVSRLAIPGCQSRATEVGVLLVRRNSVAFCILVFCKDARFTDVFSCKKALRKPMCQHLETKSGSIDTLH